MSIMIHLGNNVWGNCTPPEPDRNPHLTYDQAFAKRDADTVATYSQKFGERSARAMKLILDENRARAIKENARYYRD